MNEIRKISFAFLSLAIILCSCLSVDTTTKEPIIGNIIQKNGLVAKVYSIEEETTLFGFAATKSYIAEEGSVFFIVNTSLANLSKSRKSFDSYSLVLVDNQQHVYKLVGECSRTYINSTVVDGGSGCSIQEGFHFTSDMAPWKTEHIDQLVRGFVFYIPEGAAGLSLRVQDLPDINLGE